MCVEIPLNGKSSCWSELRILPSVQTAPILPPFSHARPPFSAGRRLTGDLPTPLSYKPIEVISTRRGEPIRQHVWWKNFHASENLLPGWEITRPVGLLFR